MRRVAPNRSTEHIGFSASETEPSLFIKHMEEDYVYNHVDDILIAIKSKDNVKNLEDASYFLGWEIKRDRALRTLKISQTKMTTNLIS
eukprot:300063-Pelagomonas_calceolata.AAC.1